MRGWGAKLRKSAKVLLAGVFVLAWFAPHAVALSAVSLDSDQTYYDHSFTLEEEMLLHVTFDSNVACPLDFATTVDPWLRLFDSTGAVIADDDDGNHNDQDNCYGSKIHMVLQPGDYVLRFRTYQEQTGLAVPEGSGTVSWSDDGYAPAPPTTTTSTTTT